MLSVSLQELHMTGCMLLADDFCLVISEGSQKAQKKYNRLMLNRIDWNQGQEDEQQGIGKVVHLVHLRHFAMNTCSSHQQQVTRVL